MDDASAGSVHGDFHLHRFDHHQRLPGLHRAAGSRQHRPHAARHIRGHHFTGECVGSSGSRFGPAVGGLVDGLGHPGRSPALALGFERGLLRRLEGADRRRLIAQEALVVGEAEPPVLDAQRRSPCHEVGAQREQFVRAHRIEPDLVEEAQQPRLAGLEIAGAVVTVLPAVPHLHGAADELVTPRAFHAVDAQVGAADADRVFRRPGARRVVLGGHEPMARVDRCGHRRAEVDVAQPQHQIPGVEHRVVHGLDIGQTVDAANELDVARAPGRVRAHRLHVLVDREARGRVVPRQRQPHGAARHVDVVDRCHAVLRVEQRVHQGRQTDVPRVVMHLQRADARCQVDDAGQAAIVAPRLQALHQRVHLKAQGEVELELTELDEQVRIARAAVDDLDTIGARCAAVNDCGIGKRCARAACCDACRWWRDGWWREKCARPMGRCGWRCEHRVLRTRDRSGLGQR